MNKKMIYVLGIFIIIVIGIIGASFALWTQDFVQSGENMIVSDCFQITLKEDKGITLVNTFPMYDRDGKQLTPYTFQVSNKCGRTVKYQLNFETTNNTTLSDFYVKFMFQNEEPVLLSEREETSVTITNGLNAYVLEKGYLLGNTTKDYSIRIWMDEGVTQENPDAMNKFFEGKITVYASYLPEYDEEEPIADFTYQREENKLIVDASTSFDNDSKIINYYYSLDGEEWISSTESSYTFEETRTYGNGITALVSLYASSIKEVYVKVEDELGNMSEVKHQSIMEELIYDETSDNNLRYIGSNPNNYVSFNNELWRIIGILKVPEGRRIKLVRDKSIGDYSINSELYVTSWGYDHDWTKSNLMPLLNQGAYWNRTSGMCYSDNSLILTPCDFSNIGLTEEVKELIEAVTWNLGGYSSPSLTVNQYYTYERGNIVFSGDSTIWKGKIGLMYPSDYGYATSGGEDVDRNTCFSKTLNTWHNYADCKENDWLFSNLTATLFFTDSVWKHYIYTVSEMGDVSNRNGSASSPFSIYPTLYLKENIQILSGFGTREMPYQLQ